MFCGENPFLGKNKSFFYFCKKMLDFFRKVRIIMTVPAIEDLCNGSTPDSDSVCGGSNPSSSAKKSRYPIGYLLFYFRGWGVRTNLNATVRWTVAGRDSTQPRLNEIEFLILCVIVADYR